MKKRLLAACITMSICISICAQMHCFAMDGMDALQAAADGIAYPEGMDVFQNGTDVLKTTPSEWISLLGNALLSEIRAPVTLLMTLLILTLLTAILGGVNDAAGSRTLRRASELICVLVCVGAAANPLCLTLERTAEALTEGSVFMGSFVPVFGGFLAAGGAVTGAASYQAMMLFAMEWIQQINVNLLFPLLRAAAALGIADAINSSMRLGGIANGMRKIVTTLLWLMMTAFAAILSIRSFVAGAADGLGAKTVKLLTSSLIPIVGGAVSEAYGTVLGSIRILQGGTGVLGIIAIAWITVPPMLSLLAYRTAFGAAGIAADLVGAEGVKRLCRDADGILVTAFAMLVSYAVTLMLSSALMLTLMT